MSFRRNLFQGRNIENFDFPFQVADDAMQMDVRKTLHPFYPMSLCCLNLNSQSFLCNVFYISANRNVLYFHKLLSIHFSSTFYK